jgi:hypothetical protein
MKNYVEYEEQYWRPEETPEESEESLNRGSSSGTIKWLLLGLGVGAGVVLLLAHKNGWDIRGSIARGCRQTLNGISRGTQELRRHGSNLLSFNRTQTG